MSEHHGTIIMVCRHVMEGSAQPEIHDPDDGDRCCTPCYDLLEQEYAKGESSYQEFLQKDKATGHPTVFTSCQACFLKATGARP